jgi:hypothetical protein
MLVPFPRAASSRLISFFTFHISICGRVSSQQSSRLQAAGYHRHKETHILLGLTSLRVTHLRCVVVASKGSRVIGGV